MNWESVWEILKDIWKVVDFVLTMGYMIAYPFLVIGLWKLVGRLDIFTRLEKVAKNLDDEYQVKGYRETMEQHEAAIKKAMQ